MDAAGFGHFLGESSPPLYSQHYRPHRFNIAFPAGFRSLSRADGAAQKPFHRRPRSPAGGLSMAPRRYFSLLRRFFALPISHPLRCTMTDRDNGPADDPFADTRMSLGDHIEELRTHL